MDFGYRLLNVFAIDGDPFSGNQLCVFDDAADLSSEQMQAWARQFNLSETSFVTGRRVSAESEGVEADVRIFTASYEMPFAGHPTLGTAWLLGQEFGTDHVALRLPAGRIPVTVVDGDWQLTAPVARLRPVEASEDAIAGMVGATGSAVLSASWAHAGVEQSLVQLADVADVRAAVASAPAMHTVLRGDLQPAQLYVWAWTGPDTLEARMFSETAGSVDEDPATGSACANLGGWLHAQGYRGRVVITQGVAVSRPSRLVLTVRADAVLVAGRVHEVGSGVVRS